MPSIDPPNRQESCPLCGGRAAAGYQPFCGRGCRDRDLLNWLGDAYRVPAEPASPAAEESGDPGLDREG